MQYPEKQANIRNSHSPIKVSMHSNQVTDRSPLNTINTSKLKNHNPIYSGRSSSPITILRKSQNVNGSPQQSVRDTKDCISHLFKISSQPTPGDIRILCEEQKLTIQIWKQKCEEKHKVLIRQEILINQLQQKVKTLTPKNIQQTHSNQVSYVKIDKPPVQRLQSHHGKIKQTSVAQMLQHQVQQLKNVLRSMETETKKALEDTRVMCMSLLHEAIRAKDDLIENLSEVFLVQLKFKDQKFNQFKIKSEIVQIENTKLELANQDLQSKIEQLLSVAVTVCK